MALRPAGPGDAPFLAEMLAAAAFWRPDGAGTVADALARPEIAHYVVGWPRSGDSGVVAEAARPVGAAWLRCFPEHDPGYGFVSALTPELAMGVLPQWRGRGIGTRLLDALVVQARRTGLRTVSLSVERDNPARRLYARSGFRTVDDTGGASTMLLRL